MSSESACEHPNLITGSGGWFLSCLDCGAQWDCGYDDKRRAECMTPAMHGGFVWRRETTQCVTGCDAPPHPPSKALCNKCLAVLDRKMRAFLGHGLDHGNDGE